jgi:hypothetical protein
MSRRPRWSVSSISVIGSVLFAFRNLRRPTGPSLAGPRQRRRRCLAVPVAGPASRAYLHPTKRRAEYDSCGEIFLCSARCIRLSSSMSLG